MKRISIVESHAKNKPKDTAYGMTRGKSDMPNAMRTKPPTFLVVERLNVSFRPRFRTYLLSFVSVFDDTLAATLRSVL